MHKKATHSPDQHTHKHERWMRHWMRHTAAVPKGFLRYELLRLLNEEPRSGSEIMCEIEKSANGYWRPSPGSIYPLLAWLQDKGNIKDAPEQEPGIKRYMLTEEGKRCLKEQAEARVEFGKRFEDLKPTPGLMGPMPFHFDREEVGELRRATNELAVSVRGLHHEMRHKYSKETVDEAKKILEEATKKIRDLTRRRE